jgi:hypothetical protein
MAAPEAQPEPDQDFEFGQFSTIRYSLPELLREVNADRASRTFAMEKLDQATITTLFEQQQANASRERDQKQ